jgi:hypothetical protein
VTPGGQYGLDSHIAKGISLVLFRAQQDRFCFDQLQGLHHVSSSALVLLEVLRLEMRLILRCACVHLEEPDLVGLVFHGYRVKRENARLDPDGRFNLLTERWSWAARVACSIATFRGIRLQLLGLLLFWASF